MLKNDLLHKPYQNLNFGKPNLKIILRVRHQAKYRANQDKQTNMDSSKILY